MYNQRVEKLYYCRVFIKWRHSLFDCFLYSVFVHWSSIYYAGTIMLLDYNTFISFSSVAVISLTLAKYFYSLPNKLQSLLIQLIISAEVVGSSLS